MVAGEIVIGKEVESHALFAIIATDGIGDAISGAEAHFASLNVDDGAERAVKRAAAAAIESSEIGSDEFPKIFLVHYWNGLVVEIRFLLEEIVYGFQAAVDGIG